MLQTFKNNPILAKLFVLTVLLNVFLHLDVVKQQFQPEKQTSVLAQSDLCSSESSFGAADPERSILKLGSLFSHFHNLNTLYAISIKNYLFYVPTAYFNSFHSLELVLLLTPDHTSGLSPPKV